MKSIYLSPSTQENNVGAGSYGTEEQRMNQIMDLSKTSCGATTSYTGTGQT